MKLSLILTGCLAACALMTSCGDDSGFRITGKITGDPNMNLYVKYYGNNAVRTAVTIANKGAFEVNGNASYPTMVEFMDNDYNVIGRAFVQDGDKLSVTLDRDNPFRINASGTDINQRWAQVSTAMADSLLNGSAQGVNDMIEGYIGEHPDDVVSTLLFATSYNCFLDPARADSVLQSIDAKARPSTVLSAYSMVAHRYANPSAYAPISRLRYRNEESDSGRWFDVTDRPLSLLVFSDENSMRRDSVVPHIKEIRRDIADKRLQIIDFYFPVDTFSFKRTVARDSADWITAWAPGGIFADGIDRLAIPSLPYYIVADSTGRQLYRGPSPAKARECLSE